MARVGPQADDDSPGADGSAGVKSSHINHLWSGLLIEELIRCGVTRFCISSGSRNSPLVLAAADNDRAEKIVHYDERGAAFYALGLARATGTPAALICTSGTALANYYPAIVESGMSGVPLLVLSADRPVELRDSRAPQTIDQVDIFGNYLRWSFDLPSPDKAISPAFLLTTVDQAVYRSNRSPRGPVQLNCQFREPLAPADEQQDFTDYLAPVERWLESDDPFTRYYASTSVIAEDDHETITSRVKDARRGVIVAGYLPAYSDSGAIVELSEHLGWPLLADVGSGLRCGTVESATNISHYDLLLRSENFAARQQPDLVLHFGGPVTSKPLQKYLEMNGANTILVHDNPSRQDPWHTVGERIEADASTFASLLLATPVAQKSELIDSLLEADRIVASILEDRFHQVDSATEPALAHRLLQLLPDESGLFLGNSMPIRDVDAFGSFGHNRVRVAVNRGASGIDGTVATAVGFAAGLECITTALIGDLALLHDLNSLALVAKRKTPVCLIVINNDGGGIFSFLPIARAERHFEHYFATPHGLSFGPAAEIYGIEYRLVSAIAEFEGAYRGFLEKGTSFLIEVNVDRQTNFNEHQEIWSEIKRELAR